MRSTRSFPLLPAVVALLAIGLLFSGSVFAAAELTVTIPLDVPGVDQQVTVDGNLDDAAWQQAEMIELPLLLHQPDIASADISGTARVFWNDSGLHVGVSITDDQLYFTDDATVLEEYDSVELWIDQFWIQASPSDSGVVLRSRYLNAFPRFDHQIEAAATRSANGYTVEFVVSKETIEVFAENPFAQGSTLRLAVGVSDRDDAETEAETIRYFPNRYGWNNTESMALATLK